MALSPGSIVRCRNRDWVLLPGDHPDLRLLRPLTGAPDEVEGALGRPARSSGPGAGGSRTHWSPATRPVQPDDSTGVGRQRGDGGGPESSGSTWMHR